ncbi:MAG: helix-turn-helix domain-containing protein [Nitrospiraceae bacterium]|nr:helix-turn-helix domain-containing protein [Nitrospiraceae bacterium]
MSKHCYTHLSDTDRETLSLGLTHGQSLRMMAKVLGRASSTVRRELVATPREATPTAPAQHRHGQPLEPVSHGDHANSWIPGCGSRCELSWLRAARLNRLPGTSDASILTTWGNSCRPRPSIWRCMCCHAEPCGASCWRHCVRRARHAGRGHEA